MMGILFKSNSIVVHLTYSFPVDGRLMTSKSRLTDRFDLPSITSHLR